MTDEIAPEAKSARKPKPVKKAKPAEREQSTIGFPYYDLDTAIGVARVILGAGALSVSRDQLAGLLDSSTNSGTFLTKMSATRMFGLITTGSGMIELTDLGSSILDTDDRRSRKARADAFLSVPLFRRVYDEFRGRQLPPRPLPLEHAFVKLGVSNSQKTTARLAFDRSAQQAGYFANGTDRLIEPIIPQGPGFKVLTPNEIVIEEPEAKAERFAAAMEAGVRRPPKGLNPFIQGLLDTLPAPETNWTIEGRTTWLQAAAKIFDLIYKGAGEITITGKAAPNAEGKTED